MFFERYEKEIHEQASLNVDDLIEQLEIILYQIKQDTIPEHYLSMLGQVTICIQARHEPKAS